MRTRPTSSRPPPRKTLTHDDEDQESELATPLPVLAYDESGEGSDRHNYPAGWQALNAHVCVCSEMYIG